MRPTLFLAWLFAGSSALAAPVVPSAENYRAGEWTYCDVRIYAAGAGTTPEAARAKIVELLDAGKGKEVADRINGHRSKITPDGWSTCPYWEAGYSYEDAEALARLWSVDVQEAKARIERKLIFKTDDGLRELIGSAPAPTVHSVPAGYTTCDAELIAAAWGSDLNDVKAAMESKISSGNKAQLDSVLGGARKSKGSDTSLCQFWTLPYSYEDAERLATTWKVDISEAKARVAAAARAGSLSKVDKALGR